ncbi:DUF4214 domain-containing protein [Geminocystis sp. NIES-3709]|uniref:DUF4214 domain-containing protein n=1 Tax=Geminocystis sp. NIES-3709 TaxID=1617448 RepID=UPI0005FC7E59|nr:DUF4214 domain-containing protein [Geminocystis sp. NIES-3709]BAQ63743.1 alkaline phosphatase [Geminocystis sp. NIES-3709]
MANFDFGIIDGNFFTNNGTVTSNSDDVFFFTLEDSSSVIHVNLFNITGGDADLELYEDSNLNGTLDSGDLLVVSSTRNNNEDEFIKILEADIDGINLDSDYLVKVFSFDGNTVDYDFSLVMTEATPSEEVGINLSPNNQTVFSDFIRGTNSSIVNRNFDAIEYTTSQQGVIFGQISTDFNETNLNVRIFDDSNNNTVFDPRDEILGQQEITRQNGFISIPVEAGRGFVQLENLSDSGYDYSLTASYANASTTDQSALTLRGGTAQIAYVAYYGRPADPSGVNFWNEILRNGNVNYSPRTGDTLTGNQRTVYNRIVNDFGNSAESNRLFGNMSNREKVNQVYNFTFGRDAETAGLNYWTTQLNNGAVTLATFALEVALGAQNQDIIVLRNKINSADLFSTSINTQAERTAYSGSSAEVFGRDWLDPFENFTANQRIVDSALTALTE